MNGAPSASAEYTKVPFPGLGERAMLKKRDLILILILLSVSAALFLIVGADRGSKRSVGTVRVLVNGVFYADVPMTEDKDFTIRQEDGTENVLHITRDGFCMAYSTCRNQLCVQQGTVTEDNYASRALGAHIICLPNRVDAELLLSPESIDPSAPDV